MKTITKTILSVLCITLLISCNDDDDNVNNLNTKIENPYSALGTTGDAYYLASTPTLSEGELSFIDNGTQLDADQAARIIASGEYLYSLNYGTGILSKIKQNDKGSYDVVKEINAGLSVGTIRPRYKLADENTIMVYNVSVEPVKNESDEIIDNINTLRLATVSIPSLTITNLTQFVIPQTINAQQGGTIGYEPMRVDAPVISNDKIYFGLMHLDMSDLTTPPPFRKPKQTGLETLVFDYPSLSNGKIVESNNASGHTSGYRAPSMHADENGDVYQSNWFMAANSFDLVEGDKTIISKLSNGTYDESYIFNISEALGLGTNIATVGWFYVGNGIGYMPIQLENEGNYFTDDSWGLIRIDVYKKTAIKLNVPMSNLFNYENAVVENDKLFLAISPNGEDAFVYEFDANSTSPNGFTKGLQIDGEDIKVEGLYFNK